MGMGVRAWMCIGLLLGGCAGSGGQADKSAETPQALPGERVQQGVSVWGGAVGRYAGRNLFALVLHDRNAMAVYEVMPDRKLRQIGANLSVGYHPDGLAYLGDGRFALTVEGERQLQIWRVQGEHVTRERVIEEPFAGRDVVAADLDGDGRLDLILSPYRGGELALYWGEEGGGFSEPQRLKTGETPWHPRVLDWNGDGRVDFVWGALDGGLVEVALNRGARRFDLTTLSNEVGLTPRQAGVGDFDGDGRSDVVYALELGRAARLLLNRGSAPAERVDIPAPAWGYVSAEILEEGTVLLGEEKRVLIGRRQSGSWAYRELPAGSLPSPLIVADLDGDGVKDLLICNSAADGATVYFGPLWEQAKPLSFPPR